jgi:hypothetical protein
MDIRYYAIWRMSGNSSQKNMIRRMVLQPITSIMKISGMNRDFVPFEEFISMPDHSISQAWGQLCRDIIPDSFWKKTNNHCLEQFSRKDIPVKDNFNMGLQSGLAGWGLSLLTELDRNNS